MSVTPKTPFGRAVVRYGSIATGLVAIAGAASYFGIVPATSMDIKNLERKQLRYAIPSLEYQLDSYIIRRGKLEELPSNEYFTLEKKALDRKIENLQRDLGTAYERRNKIGN